MAGSNDLQIHLDPRRARAQPQEHRPRPPARQAGRDHRPVGLGQVLARLRHDLRRGPAPLRRVAVGLCAPVPGDDAEAGRRPDRRPVAGHLHRAEDDLASNPRSTVGTVTEIYDYMRLLFARVGVPYSPATGLPIESQTVSQMVDRVLALPEGTRLYLLAPIVRGRKGEYRKELAELQKKGFQRVKIDGTFYEIARRAHARQEAQARHRRGGRPHGRARRTSPRGSPTASRRRSSSPTASPSPSSPTSRWPHLESGRGR